MRHAAKRNQCGQGRMITGHPYGRRRRVKSNVARCGNTASLVAVRMVERHTASATARWRVPGREGSATELPRNRSGRNIMSEGRAGMEGPCWWWGGMRGVGWWCGAAGSHQWFGDEMSTRQPASAARPCPACRNGLAHGERRAFYQQPSAEGAQLTKRKPFVFQAVTAGRARLSLLGGAVFAQACKGRPVRPAATVRQRVRDAFMGRQGEQVEGRAREGGREKPVQSPALGYRYGALEWLPPARLSTGMAACRGRWKANGSPHTFKRRSGNRRRYCRRLYNVLGVRSRKCIQVER